MQFRPNSISLLLCLLVGPSAVRATEAGLAEATRAMVESEQKFYQTGQEKGTRAAFLEFLADDGIVFRPGPLNGKEAWGKRPESGLDLIWEPTFAAIARSGDFGYTTGPARWRANKKDEKFLGYGQFVSIWKKQKDGSWKVALDCGIENPEPAGKPETLRTLVPDESQQTKYAEGHRKALPLPKAHQQFVEAAKTNSAEATLGVAAEEIRIYREGSFPAVGKNAASALLSAKTGKMSFEQLGGDMSSSGDLAYNYGKYSLSRDGSVEPGHFFQIWQTDAVGMWKLVVDWQQALPPEKPAK
jgi:ketosteroid isomerase-like protein